MTQEYFNFEKHITVKVDLSKIDLFKQLCYDHGAKPIIVNLHNGENHVMTSETINTKTPIDIITNINLMEKFVENGIEPIRVKVESEPSWIDYKESIGYNRRESFLYLEIHVPCKSEKLYLLENVIMNDWHKSSNEFKKGITFLTYRTKDEQDIKYINLDITNMKLMGVVSENFKHHFEYAIWDENEELDSNWIKGK